MYLITHCTESHPDVPDGLTPLIISSLTSFGLASSSWSDGPLFWPTSVSFYRGSSPTDRLMSLAYAIIETAN